MNWEAIGVISSILGGLFLLVQTLATGLLRYFVRSEFAALREELRHEFVGKESLELRLRPVEQDLARLTERLA